MPSTLDLCEKYFGTRDIYGLLELTKNSIEKDIKKAYYKLSLKVHPDRVPENEKEIATEKFKVLAKIHQVLTDKIKKKLYDENGIVDDDDDENKLSAWLEIWRTIFKPISTEDIDNYQKEYVGSDLERMDIKKAYVNGKGCINFMMNSIPFMQVEDEPRIEKIVKEMIDAKEVPEYKIFLNEPKQKKQRRHKKYAHESLKAEEIKRKMKENGVNLEAQIMKRQEERKANFDSLFDNLLNKYGKDDSKSFSVKNLGKQKKKKTANTSNGDSKEKMEGRRVLRGRISKQGNSTKTK